MFVWSSNASPISEGGFHGGQEGGVNVNDPKEVRHPGDNPSNGGKTFKSFFDTQKIKC